MERYFKDMKKMLQYQRGDNLISELEVILVGIKQVELGGFRLELRGKTVLAVHTPKGHQFTSLVGLSEVRVVLLVKMVDY